MLSCVLLSVLAIAARADNSPPTVGATVNKQGVTEIFGNSFGRPGFNETYDYIIVGGGNAGNTIAARLALDPANYSIAVVEAGSFYELYDGNRTQIPGNNYINTIDFPIGEVSTLTQIGLNTLPQAGYNGREIFYIAAQTFGGGSAANYMGYHRSTVGAFDQWAEQLDDDFWTWDNVYPAYKKSCDFTPPDPTKIPYKIDYDPSAFIPGGGPLHVSYGSYFGPSGPFIQEAFKRSGFKSLAGLNSGELLGYSTMTAAVDTRTATRETSETSFLQAAARGSSIKIYPNALVKRVTFDAHKRATGVDVQSNSITAKLKYHLTARKEVILSAGLWHSPQLLMVSGIGPAATLKEHDIPVLVDLPGVGQNQWDQPIVPIVYSVNVSTNTQVQAGNPEVVAQVTAEYLDHQSGPLSGVGAGLAFAFEKFPQSLRNNFSKSTQDYLKTFPADWPEVEYLFLENVPVAGIEAVAGSIGPNDNYIIMSGVLLSTASKGNMTIISSDTLDQPIISPNYLLEEADVEQAYAAFMRMREINVGNGMIKAEAFPGPTVTERDDIITYLRDNMDKIYHGFSTCKMGLATDTSSVIDSRARVHGVTGLRVVDASSFHTGPPGHPMSSVYMFAEKIAESILEGQ